MNNHEHTISVANATSSINQIYNALKSRNINIKKSDCTQLVSKILNYTTSNELELDIKQHNLEQQKQNKFDRNGQCKQHKSFQLKNYNCPFQLQSASNKKPLVTIIGFDEDFHIAEGHHYIKGDYLFAQNKFEAFKFIVDWEKNSHSEYILYDEHDSEEVETEGYWFFSLRGDAGNLLGTDYSISTYNSNAYINSKNLPLDVLEEFIINEFLDMSAPFFFYTRESFSDYIRDCFEEKYDNDFSAQFSDDEFIAYIRKYLPHLGIDIIVSSELGRSAPNHLKLLGEFNANFTSPNLMINAAETGNIDTCDFLISMGNSVAAFTQAKGDKFPSDFYTHAHCHGSNCGRLKMFYKVTTHYGVDINLQDNNHESVLHHCAQYGNAELYQFLVSLGANETIKNTSSVTPKELFEQNIAKEKDRFSILFNK
jgi:hypothetical protein